MNEFPLFEFPPIVRKGQVRAWRVAGGRARARVGAWPEGGGGGLRPCGSGAWMAEEVSERMRARSSSPSCSGRCGSAFAWRRDALATVSCALRWMAGGRGRAAGAGLENLWRELFGHAFEACDMNVRVSVPAVGVVVCYVEVSVLLYGVASVRARKEICHDRF